MKAENIQEQDLFESEQGIQTWVEVILPLAIPKLTRIQFPQFFIIKIKIGCRAEVVFGKNKKICRDHKIFQ